jgi:hypothetical protein
VINWMFRTALALTLLIMSYLQAQEPPKTGDEEPPRLMKKVKPGADREPKPNRGNIPPTLPDEDKKSAPDDKGMGDAEPMADESGEDEQEVLNRVAENMRRSENDLANKELGEGTRQVQRDILKDLDALIEQEKNGNQDSASSSDSSSSPSSGSKSKGSRSQSAKGKGGKKQGGTQMAKGSGQNNQPKEGSNSKGANQPGKMGTNPGSGGSGSKESDPDKLADVYKDIWGHLPETLRAEMNAYASKEEFMNKYKDMLKQYYTTIAEKGRRKGG